jgi:Pilus formation protein N terminal region
LGSLTCLFGGVFRRPMRKARESSMALVLWRLVLALVLSFCAVSVIAPRPAPAADMSIVLDQAALVKLPPKVGTIIIGNPAIADVTLQPGGLMVVTGKGYGITNFIVLDGAGKILVQKSVEVREPRNLVVVLLGQTKEHDGRYVRESYSCTPQCDRRVNLGDSVDFFSAAVGEINARNGLAAGAGPPPVK